MDFSWCGSTRLHHVFPSNFHPCSARRAKVVAPIIKPYFCTEFQHLQFRYMARFHKLKIKDIRRETDDCVSIAFDVPESLSEEFRYKQGQYLTLKVIRDGQEYRRSYSACSSPVVDEDLRIAVKSVEGGRVSPHLNNGIKPGEEIEVMKPMGNFYTEMPAETPQSYVAFAAGSGITPVMSLLKTALATHPENRFTLFYGNRSYKEVIFKNELDALSEKYSDRFQVHYILSREPTDDPLFYGRMDSDKCDALMGRFINTQEADEIFLCGPFEMINTLRGHLISKGIPIENVHYELFTTEVHKAGVAPTVEQGEEAESTDTGGGGNVPVDEAQVVIVLDGEETEITVREGESILDAALDAGLDAPYACTGGSCCTCRAKRIEGDSIMDVNYALTDKEVEQGYILTCQSHPTTKKMRVDYDEP